MLDAPNTRAKKSAEERSCLGNFEILRDSSEVPMLLGKGTFGRTYKARHRFLDTIVVLKVINEQYASNPVARQRFLVEGKAVARLSHPHIARLHDFGEADGVLYYAMEFCSGGSLADYVLQHGAFEVPQLIDVAIQISNALECAHAAGFVHRDVKPSNVMLAGPKLPLWTKLIDFGLVHATTPDTLGTSNAEEPMSEGRLIGTLLFASPEQLREQPVDGGSDLFSLGMTLWYLATGAPPESGGSAEIVSSRLNSESYAPRLPRSLPGELRQVLGRLLEKDVSRRFTSAGEALAAFRQCGVALGLKPVSSPIEAAIADDANAHPAMPMIFTKEQTCPPAIIESADGPLESEFKLLVRDGEAITGAYYSAEPLAAPGKFALLHVLLQELIDDGTAFERIRSNIGRIRSLALAPVIEPATIRKYSDFTIVAMEKPAGGDLLTALRAQGVVSFAGAHPFLQAIANTSDQMQGMNLPGVDLRAASILLESKDPGAPSPPTIETAAPKLLPRLLTALDIAGIVELADRADTGPAMTTDTFCDLDREDEPCAQFAKLLYRIVAGRNCHAAASLSAQGFVAVPGLSEQSNRILSLVIARQTRSLSCVELLRELLNVEGLSSSIAGSKAGLTATSIGTRTHPIPPSVQRSETGTATKPLPSHLASEQMASTVAKTADRVPLPPIEASSAATSNRRTPLPPLVHSGTPAPRRTGVWIGAAVAITVLGIGITIFFKSRPAERPITGPTDIQRTPASLTAQSKQPLPENIFVQLQDGLPNQPTFKIGNKIVGATRKGDGWSLPLRDTAMALPFNVTVEEAGYDKKEFTIRTADELAKGATFKVDRSKGKIEFIGIPSEYVQASCLMKDALPEEKDHVDVPKFSIGTELHGDGTPPLELPTGIYLVSLKGKSAKLRWPVLAALKRESTFAFNLPPLVDGRYAGQVLEVNLVTKTSESWIRRDSERQTLVDGRLNASGAYVARALPSATAGPDSGESTISIRLVDGETYDVYAAHADATDPQNFKLLGTVHRLSDRDATERSRRDPEQTSREK